MRRRPGSQAPAELRPVPGFPAHLLAADGSVWSTLGWSGLRRLQPQITGSGRAWVKLRVPAERRTRCAYVDNLLAAVYPERPAPPPPGPAVEYRPVPGWPRYRVGSDRSVWHNRTAPSLPYPWNAPRWVRLQPLTLPGRAPRVTLRQGPRASARSVAIVHRAAFAPAEQGPYWARRLGAGGVPTPDLAPALVPLPPQPQPQPPDVRATAARPAWILALSRRTNGAGLVARATVAPPPAEPPPLFSPVEFERPGGYALGEKHGRARLTEATVIEARRLHRAGWTFAALARRYCVSANTIMYAVKGKTWSQTP